MEDGMYIDKVKNSGKPYLRVAESYSAKVGGVRKNRKRTVRNIGPLARFDDGKPDFLKRLRQSFKDGAPIIDGLDDLAARDPEPRKRRIEFDLDDDGAAFSDPKAIGHFFLDAMYDGLGIYDVLNKHKSGSRIEYDLNGLAKLLVFGRALDPDSKCATWEARGDYLFGVTTSQNVIEAYRTLDVLDELSEKIQRRMNTRIEKHVGRSKDICFYDVTNYWFAIDDPDEDVVTKTGAVIEEGMRRRGPSKKKTREPIVQMGLFIDDNGLPVSYKLFPGNHTDQTTLRPAMKETIGRLGYERVIIVADGGLNSGKNLAYILGQGNGYIVSKSAKGSAKEVKAWILDEDGYVWNKNRTFKLKSKTRTRTVEDEDGKSVEIKERIISYWSKKQHDYALHENKKFIDYLNSVAENPDKLKDKQPKYKKYLVETKADKETGEVVNAVSVYSLDMKKIETDLGLMGYYTLLTSEMHMDEHEVIDKYHGLSRIEDSFRVIKSDLEGRPVYVRSKGHINAHFLICFIALTMTRILQYKILKNEGKATNSTRDWEMGMPAARIKKALAGFKADAVPQGYYRLTKSEEGSDIARIADAVGVDIALRLPSESEIRKLKHEIDKVIFM
jgi:transposase